MSRQIERISGKGKGALAGILNMIYPPRCLSCPEVTEKGMHLCAKCWSETAFITGTVCRSCGSPLQGEYTTNIQCDDCITHPPAWSAGRAAVLYSGGGRRAVLALKHGDRLDMARPMAEWMAHTAPELLQSADVIAPVPLHWRRLLKRRFNQSAELARHLAEISGKPYVPDLLIRKKATPTQDGLTRTERHENQRGVFALNSRHTAYKHVLLIDDVMTTGATLSACTEILRAAGADKIDALVFARVARGE